MFRQSPSRSLASLGTAVDKIPVRLSYQIIKHFSDSLYQSPTKAIEELAANSYDAWASNVHVIMPAADEMARPDATLWVVDDGEGMDIDGFKNLWLVGESNKRTPERERSKRPPIGKFGIGKLATYVLAKQLTHICKYSDKFYAVTMDFAELENEKTKQHLTLDARELTESEARLAVKSILDSTGTKCGPVVLFGSQAAPHWTVAAMSSLRDMARRLTEGRLGRVLRSALPVNPQFNLVLNGTMLLPTKLDRHKIDSWTIGKADRVAQRLRFDSVKARKGTCGIDIAGLGFVHGTVDLYEDALVGDKSEKWGRSHGFFVLVRGRLINLHDELFGLEALSHGAFSRFRMLVHADGLDAFLRSTRETVAEEEPAVASFRTYLKEKFNEARARFESWLAEKEQAESLAGKVGRAPRSYSRQPLAQAIRKLLRGEVEHLRYISIPKDLDAKQRELLLKQTEDALESDKLFESVRFESLGVEKGLAEYDVAERVFKVNLLHPFFVNYGHTDRTHESFQILAVTEVLTEAYLLEQGVAEQDIASVLERRDRFLRALVYSKRMAAPLVAQLLADNRSDPQGLEKAVAAGLDSLGFEVTPLGGSGKPDGIALARMGVRKGGASSETYSLTYDAKSTAKDRVSAKDVGAATIRDHRDRNKAQYALVVAPAFEGENDPDSNVSRQARSQSITLMTLADLIRLVLVASTKPLGFNRIRDELLTACHDPIETHQWVDGLWEEEVPETPLLPILETIWEMQKDCPDPPQFAGIRERLAARSSAYSSTRGSEICDLVTSVSRLTGEFIAIDGEAVYLNAPPARILSEVTSSASHVPRQLLQRSIYAELDRKAQTYRGSGRKRRTAK